MYEDLKTDCRRFRWDRPCAPHKRTGVTCPTCREYDPIQKRLLVVKLAALGDVLRTTALLPAIRAAYPGCHITWITKPGAVALFEGNDQVDEVLATDDAGAMARLAVLQFDAVLCPDADPEAALLAAAARVKAGGERRGFTADGDGKVMPLGEGAVRWFRMGISDPLKRSNTATYQALVAGVLGLDPATVGEPVLVPRRADVTGVRAWRDGLGHRGRLIGLNTGAGGRWLHKQWTLEHQVAFLHGIAGDELGVLLLGGPEERDRNAALLRAANGLPVFDAGTDNDVSRFAALVECCSAMVTGDTFAMHVAIARGVPAVVLFGPTSSAEIELYGRGEKVVPPGLDCLCCYLPVCDVTPHCQALIEPAEVIAAVRRWL